MISSESLFRCVELYFRLNFKKNTLSSSEKSDPQITSRLGEIGHDLLKQGNSKSSNRGFFMFAKKKHLLAEKEGVSTPESSRKVISFSKWLTQSEQIALVEQDVKTGDVGFRREKISGFVNLSFCVFVRQESASKLW